MINYNNNLTFTSFKQTQLPIVGVKKEVITPEQAANVILKPLEQRALKKWDITRKSSEKAGIKENEISGKIGNFKISALLSPGQGNQSLGPLEEEKFGIKIKHFLITYFIPQKDIDKHPVIQKAVQKLENDAEIITCLTNGAV